MSQTPRYYQADESSNEHKDSGGHDTGFQRPHREHHELELGVTEIAEGRTDVQRIVATSGGLANSQFRARWQTRKPEWLGAMVAE